MKEIWKDIKDYEGLYQVSNLGRVKSLSKKHKIKGGNFYYTDEMILKNIQKKDGYEVVNLSKNNISTKKSVHRLVAQAFIPNKHNYKCVNHKDENKRNNKADNLEWCSYSYNNNYGTHIKRQKEKLTNNKKRSIAVVQYDLKKNKIKEYPSMREAQRQTKISYIDISNVCKNKRKTAGGYKWKYMEE